MVATCSVSAAPYTHDRLNVRGAVGLGAGWLRGSWTPDGLPEGEEGTSTVRASGLMPELTLLFGGTPRSGLVLGGGVLSFEVVFFADYYFRPTNEFHITSSVGPTGVTLSAPNLC